MGWFFDEWVYGVGIPEYSFKSNSSVTGDSRFKVTCSVKQSGVKPDFKMLIPLTVYFADDKYINLRVWVDKPECEIELPVMPYEPKKIIFNSYDAVLCKVKYERW